MIIHAAVRPRRSISALFIATTPITPGLRVVPSKIGNSFTALQFSSLTGAGCCRIEDAEAPILERSRSLSKPPGNHGKEQDAICSSAYVFTYAGKGPESHDLCLVSGFAKPIAPGSQGVGPWQRPALRRDAS